MALSISVQVLFPALLEKYRNRISGAGVRPKKVNTIFALIN